jgi:sugar lactone lactonase YvrE
MQCSNAQTRSIQGSLKRRLTALVAAGLLAGTAQAQSCDPAPSGMAAWWPGEGDANDIVGTNNGVLLGGLGFTNGEVGQGFWFTTTNQGVVIPASPSLDIGYGPGFTIECWINPSELSIPHAIGEWNNGTFGVELFVSADGAGDVFAGAWKVSNGYSYECLCATGAGVVATNASQHVALTYDKQSDVATLYYNGVQVGQGFFYNLIIGMGYNSYLGYSPSEGRDFAGVLDEVTLYNRALSGGEIAAIYNAGLSGKCPSPPSIAVPPASQPAVIGERVTFNMVVDGSEPLAYQWLFNGAPLAGQTNASLTLPSVTTNNAGNYTVVVASAYGCVTSSPPAVLTVYPAPFITNQPINQAVWAGGNVALNVGVSITGPFTCQYQWLHDGTNLPNGIITTVAGNGTNGYTGDGGAAIHARLNDPYAVAVDAQGNLFIADNGNNVIRKVNANGMITTMAGNGTNGYSGDGGTATHASLNSPAGLALDAKGNLYISDYWNDRIREVQTNGIIRTVAGNGAWDYTGDGGSATNATLYAPIGLAADAFGNLFIADSENCVIRKMDTNGIITTVAGNGPGGFGDGGPATNAVLGTPEGVALDALGNLFIADASFSMIRKVNTNGIITTLAGMYAPSGLTVDTAGNLFIADPQQNQIMKLGTNGIITTLAGTGTAGYSGDGGMPASASVNGPSDVALDVDNNLFIADGGNNRIRKVFPIQGSTLPMHNVSTGNAGSYQVIITGPAGCLTSSVVNLTVTTSPLIFQTALNGNGSLTLGFVSQPASTSRVLCATNLAPPVNWQPIWTNLTGGTWQFTDTNTGSSTSKFYRLSTP